MNKGNLVITNTGLRGIISETTGNEIGILAEDTDRDFGLYYVDKGTCFKMSDDDIAKFVVEVHNNHEKFKYFISEVEELFSRKSKVGKLLL